ncbi:MAG: secretin N-terminal domain-containing protein [Candidatus Aminicenantia bacterium]
MKKISKVAFYFIIFILFISCAGRIAFKRGEEAYRTKDWDRAVEEYLRALQTDPDNPRYRLSLAKALIEASNFHSERGEGFLKQGELKLALLEFQKALDYNPENLRARKRKKEILKRIEQERRERTEKTEIERMKERAKKKPLEKPILGPGSETLINLKFKDADLKKIFKTLQKLSGINVLFDEAFKSKKVSIDLLNVTFKEALERLLLVTRLFYKILDEQTILIIPDTPAKRREYEELILRTFYLSNADVNQIQSLLRTLADIKTIAVNPTLNTISIRETPKKMEVAERIIASQDKSQAELLIDVEILEVNKSRMREYGIELSNYQITESLVPGTVSGDITSSLVRGHMFYAIDSSDFLFSIPSVSYKLLESDTKSKIIAKPQLRVVDGETVSVKLGDKVPVPVTTFVPIAAGGVNQQAITSYQMYDVGINVELTPRVHHNGDITLKLKFELTFITTPGTATMPPTIGNRSVTTIIRMRDNETGLLAGLLRDAERRSLRGFPGINSIPILNKIFAGTSEEVSQTDIILTLTPRITRMPDISEEDLASFWVGTEGDIGVKTPPPQTLFKEDTKEQNREAREERKEKEGKEEEIEEPGYEKPVIYLMPSLIEAPVKTEFMVKAMIENVDNIGSLSLVLNFDPTIIQVKEIKEGRFMSQDGVGTSFLQSVDNSSGKIQIGITRKGFKEGMKGSGELISILFTSVKEGEKNLFITNAALRTPSFTPIPVQLRQAEIVIK